MVITFKMIEAFKPIARERKYLVDYNVRYQVIELI